MLKFREIQFNKKRSTVNLDITDRITVEDILNFKNSTSSKSKKLKISGTKLELAQRVVDAVRDHDNDVFVVDGLNNSTADGFPTLTPSDSFPDVSELKSGLTSDVSSVFPKLKLSYVENNLLNSSHRTEDQGYIHKIMINEISHQSRLCYVRSKYYPSMKSGIYEQWMLIIKTNHIRFLKPNAPVQQGEGCSHIAGLSFAREGRPNHMLMTTRMLHAHQSHAKTLEHIVYASDKYLNVINEVNSEGIFSQLAICSEEIFSEIDILTKGQHKNPLTGQLTASIFHDIKIKKDSTKSDNLVSKILNIGEFVEIKSNALVRGRKQECIAKKRYTAYKKLKQKKLITVTEKGLILNPEFA
ncbi:hypothetical protein KUTeg_019798 [Tegillarca granosa]|uniref:Uncharacterized protein n=1 Tax=Tegillarca granosa TaxID=220873 RepID=A0ABQ9EIM2_TEGGR|nr:hypothetical protein KUTeg_019798 [Tegillarca granosa]